MCPKNEKEDRKKIKFDIVSIARLVDSLQQLRTSVKSGSIILYSRK